MNYEMLSVLARLFIVRRNWIRMCTVAASVKSKDVPLYTNNMSNICVVKIHTSKNNQSLHHLQIPQVQIIIKCITKIINDVKLCKNITLFLVHLVNSILISIECALIENDC